MTPPLFALFTFRFAPNNRDPDQVTQSLLEKINADGRIYLTQTRHDDKFVIRMTLGQFDMTEADVDVAIDVIEELARSI